MGMAKGHGVAIRQLLASRCVDSAEKLCSLHLAACARPGTATSYTEALELMGDILREKAQYKRALAYYRQASQQKRLAIAGQAHKARRSLTGDSFETLADSHLCYKECLCHLELGDPMTALRALDMVPQRLRDVGINILLGKVCVYVRACVCVCVFVLSRVEDARALNPSSHIHAPHAHAQPLLLPGQLHRHNNQRPRAIACYSQAVLQMPCAVEALEALVALGMDAPEILALVDGACRDRPDAALYTDGWVHALVTRYWVEPPGDATACLLDISSTHVRASTLSPPPPHTHTHPVSYKSATTNTTNARRS